MSWRSKLFLDRPLFCPFQTDQGSWKWTPPPTIHSIDRFTGNLNLGNGDPLEDTFSRESPLFSFSSWRVQGWFHRISIIRCWSHTLVLMTWNNSFMKDVWPRLWVRGSLYTPNFPLQLVPVTSKGSLVKIGKTVALRAGLRPYAHVCRSTLETMIEKTSEILKDHLDWTSSWIKNRLCS